MGEIENSIQKANEVKNIIHDLLVIHDHYADENNGCAPECLEAAASILATICREIAYCYQDNEPDTAMYLEDLLDTEFFNYNMEDEDNED